MSAKSELKRLLRPIAQRFNTRVDARVDARVVPISAGLDAQITGRQADVDRRVASLADDLEGLSRYLPTVINTIATQNASSREQRRRLQAAEDDLGALRATVDNLGESFAYLESRVEFVRKEILYETRYGSGSGSGPSSGSGSDTTEPVPEPKILNLAKLEDMSGNLRINVGAGHLPLADYLNVDSRMLPGIDVTADARHLPFEPGELTEIYSSHVLEHFPQEQLRRTVLPHWASLLKDEGKLVAIVPDMDTMVIERAAGRLPFDDFREVVYGSQEYEGDFHFNGFSQQSLVSMLEDVGLGDVRIREAARRNGACYEMEIEAVRKADPSDSSG